MAQKIKSVKECNDKMVHLGIGIMQSLRDNPGQRYQDQKWYDSLRQYVDPVNFRGNWKQAIDRAISILLTKHYIEGSRSVKEGRPLLSLSNKVKQWMQQNNWEKDILRILKNYQEPGLFEYYNTEDDYKPAVNKVQEYLPKEMLNRLHEDVMQLLREGKVEYARKIAIALEL